MDLVREPLDDVLRLDPLLPLGNGILVLVLGRQHGVRNRDAGSVVGVDHGRVAGGGGLERGALLGGEVDDLAAPAEADDAPFFDAAVLALDLLEHVWDALDRLWWCAGRLEELAELLALFVLRLVRWMR